MTDEEKRINCIHYEEGWECDISPALKCDGGCGHRRPHFKKELDADLKPKFKVGQTIRYIGGMDFYPKVLTISEIIDNLYWDKDGLVVPIKFQDKWELVEKTNTPIWHDAKDMQPDGNRYVLCYDGKYASVAHYKEVVNCKWAYVDDLLKL